MSKAIGGAACATTRPHGDNLLVTCLSVKNITIRRDSVMDVCNEIFFEGIWSFMPVKKWEEDRRRAAPILTTRAASMLTTRAANSMRLIESCSSSNRSSSLFVVLGVCGL